MVPRYALYYAPSAVSTLHLTTRAWLGRDPFTGERVPHDGPGELRDLDIDALTRDPRHYGFHATLKAPFELSEAHAECDLLEFAQRFSTLRTAFSAAIRIETLGAFIAFQIEERSAEMQTLHDDCVRSFEPFRAPLSGHDLARRRKAALTVKQDARLVAFGYPYIFEDFRFHMTLTSAIGDEALRRRVIFALQAHFAQSCGPHLFATLSVFKQPSRDSEFLNIGQFPFGA